MNVQAALTLLFALIQIYGIVGRSNGKNVLELHNDEVAIMQFHSKPLLTKSKKRNYWLTAAQWNSHYCRYHGHKYIYYGAQTGNSKCKYDDTEDLHAAWCKVIIPLKDSILPSLR